MNNRLLMSVVAILVTSTSGCGIGHESFEYIVSYGAKGTSDGMTITITTPNGTEQHRAGATFSSPEVYTFKAGDHAYISAQNQSDHGEVTVKLNYSRKGLPRVSLASTSTGGYSIATVSWLVGDEKKVDDGGLK